MANPSVISGFIDCPQCGFPAQKDEYYVVEEERVLCDYCGYTHTKIRDNIATSKGYGSVHYVRMNETENGSKQETEIIRFNTSLDLSARNEVLQKIYDDCDQHRSSMFIWTDEHGLEALHGATPKTLSEQYEEEIQHFKDEFDTAYEERYHED